MGQKVHPTGFRLGVTETHKSVWFSNYYSFSDVLKEDYKIRQFFEKEFPVLYTQWFMPQESKWVMRQEQRAIVCSIFRLEIKRKINQLEILIYSTRTGSIAACLEDQELLLNLKNTIKRFLNDSRYIRLKVLRLLSVENESLLVARALVEEIEKRVDVRRALRGIRQKLEDTRVKGFKVQVSGRFNGRSIASTEWVKGGRLPLQTLRADISYTALSAHTRSGILGVKVWLFNKEVN